MRYVNGGDPILHQLQNPRLDGWSSTAFPTWGMFWEDSETDVREGAHWGARHCWYCGSRIGAGQERCQGCNARSWDRTR